jgi:hypothetical protein
LDAVLQELEELKRKISNDKRKKKLEQKKGLLHEKKIESASDHFSSDSAQSVSPEPESEETSRDKKKNRKKIKQKKGLSHAKKIESASDHFSSDSAESVSAESESEETESIGEDGFVRYRSKRFKSMSTSKKNLTISLKLAKARRDEKLRREQQAALTDDESYNGGKAFARSN